jgi:hypothetical protein
MIIKRAVSEQWGATRGHYVLMKEFRCFTHRSVSDEWRVSVSDFSYRKTFSQIFLVSNGVSDGGGE